MPTQWSQAGSIRVGAARRRHMAYINGRLMADERNWGGLYSNMTQGSIIVTSSAPRASRRRAAGLLAAGACWHDLALAAGCGWRMADGGRLVPSPHVPSDCLASSGGSPPRACFEHFVSPRSTRAASALYHLCLLCRIVPDDSWTLKQQQQQQQGPRMFRHVPAQTSPSA